MLDLKLIRENPERVKKALKDRRQEIDIQSILDLDIKKRERLASAEDLKRQRNEASKAIGLVKRQGGDSAAEMASMKEVSDRIGALDGELREIDEALAGLLLNIPNIPHESVPIGAGEQDNPVVRTWGEPKKFPFTPLNHWDIGETLDIIDFDRAGKIAGARFAVMKGAGARLERALINFMLDLQTGRGYTEMLPPFLVNRESMQATGQLPKFEEDLFHVDDGFFLIPTAEVPVTNYPPGGDFKRGRPPAEICGLHPVLPEGGRLVRQGHQGAYPPAPVRQGGACKIRPAREFVRRAGGLAERRGRGLKRLELPYRIVSLCTGDLGFSAAKTYDIEVWLPGQEPYREISSCSNFEDFQARRADIRYRPSSGKGTALVHTLNGSGLAVGRTLVAVLENYQEQDGTVVVPDALRPYMGGLTKIK